MEKAEVFRTAFLKALGTELRKFLQDLREKEAREREKLRLHFREELREVRRRRLELQRLFPPPEELRRRAELRALSKGIEELRQNLKERILERIRRDPRPYLRFAVTTARRLLGQDFQVIAGEPFWKKGWRKGPRETLRFAKEPFLLQMDPNFVVEQLLREVEWDALRKTGLAERLVG